MTRLINSELEDYLENTSDMKSQLNEALYNHYTQCNTLSKTGSIKEMLEIVLKNMLVQHILVQFREL